MATNNPAQAIAEVARVVQAWDGLGAKRVGSSEDLSSVQWLANQAGLAAPQASHDLQTWPFLRPVEHASNVQVPSQKGAVLQLHGLALADAPTGEVCANIVPLGTPTPAGQPTIGVATVGADAATLRDQTFSQLRASAGHVGIVIATASAGGELAPLNAAHFPNQIACPVLQIAGVHGPQLDAWARARSHARLRCDYRLEPAQACNVIAELHPNDKDNDNDKDNGEHPQAPLVILTPRTSWYTSTGERAGGIVLWLHLLRTLALARRNRRVVWVATAGHELGHLGLRHFLTSPIGTNLLDPVAPALWLHLGANIGAHPQPSGDEGGQSIHPTLTLRGLSPQVDPLRAMLTSALPGHVLAPALMPDGAGFLGEANDIAAHGGQVLSLIGRNALFHSPQDRWPHNVNLSQIETIARVLAVWASNCCQPRRTSP